MRPSLATVGVRRTAWSGKAILKEGLVVVSFVNGGFQDIQDVGT
jgi:hypothetical protein